MYWKTDDTYGDLQLLEKELKKEFVQVRLRGEYYQRILRRNKCWDKKLVK